MDLAIARFKVDQGKVAPVCKCHYHPGGTEVDSKSHHRQVYRVVAWVRSASRASTGKLGLHDSPVCPRDLCGAGALFWL